MRFFVFLFFVTSDFIIYGNYCKSIPEGYYYRGEAVVTKWPTTNKTPINDIVSVQPTEGTATKHEPGWVRKQLLKFGQVASKIGNAMGGHANKISAALDKICEVLKTVIPLLAAVCHVGEFGFCTATDEAPIKLSEAMNANSLDLDSLDK